MVAVVCVNIIKYSVRIMCARCKEETLRSPLKIVPGKHNFM